MPTVEQLKLRRQDLQDKLDAGDLSVQTALDQIDRAISARTLKVRQSQQRLEAVKAAVASGMDKDTARRINNKVRSKSAVAKALYEARAKRLLNRF
jgi:hypothetical protein